MEKLVAPDTCKYGCDVREQHYRRWRPGIGWHGWVPPTDAQRLERMKAKRAVRLAARKAVGR